MMFFSINCRSSLPNGPGGLAGSPGIHVAVEAEPQSEAPAYTLQIGDELDIKFFYDPELNEKVTIRPDGKITLGLIDDLQAAGLTPAQLDQEITNRYSKVLKEQHINQIIPKALSVAFPFITYLGTIKIKDQNVIRNVPSSSGGGP